MAKYDAEDLLDDVVKVIGDNIEAKIQEIETAKAAKGKGLDPALKPIPAGSIYTMSWSEKILNSLPALFIGIEDIKPVSNSGPTAETIRIFVEVIFADNGMQNDASRRVLRYAQALKEIAEKKFGSIRGFSSQFTVESISPVTLRPAVDSSEELKVGGILVTTSLA